MITISKLADNFHPVEELSPSLIRCGDTLPKRTIYTYFKICEDAGHSSFLISEGIIDDAFAELVLQAREGRPVNELTKEALGPNRFDFTHVLYVPHQFHSELKGRLDAERANTTLCVPIFNSEFSGSEKPDEFISLRRNSVHTYEWTEASLRKSRCALIIPRAKAARAPDMFFLDLSRS